MADRTLVMFLHGYGSNGADMMSLSYGINGQEFLFFAPDAPFPFEDFHQGFQWFSLKNLDDSVLWSGAELAREKLITITERKLKSAGLEYKDLIVVGFSQGVMIGIHTFAQAKIPIKGFVGFSGTLVAPKIFETRVASKFPICLIHGDKDSIVPLSFGTIASQYLKKTGFNVDFHKIPNLEHHINDKGIQIMKDFVSGLSV